MDSVFSMPEVLNKAAERLEQSLRGERGYWPAANNNDMHERNLSIYLGMELNNSYGFSVLHEATFSRGSNEQRQDKKLDMLAINTDKKIMIRVEAKRLHTIGKIQEITGKNRDVDRLKKFELNYLHEYNKYKMYNKTYWESNYSVVLISCWVKGADIYPKKWTGLLEHEGSRNDWTTLIQTLKDKNFILGGRTIDNYELNKCPDSKWRHWMLWAYCNDMETVRTPQS